VQSSGPHRRRAQRRRTVARLPVRTQALAGKALRPLPTGRRQLARSARRLNANTRHRVRATGRAMREAALTVNAAIASPPERRSIHAFRQRPLVYAGMLAYAVLSIALMATHAVGITSEHAILIALVLFSLVGKARPFVWDWLPFLFIAVMFEDLTGVGAQIAGAVHTAGPIVFEKTILGGAVATTWLQDRLGHGLIQHIFENALVAEYLFHFAAPLAAGLWLWWRHREWFSTFVSAYFLVMAVGFLVYLVFPEMPPWLAARDGLLPHVQRMVVDTLQQVGGFGQFYAGADPEPNAAMPSLHVSVPMAIACTIVAVRGARRWTSWLWMLYPLSLSFGVLYLGEHYVADAVAGLILGGLGFGVAVMSRNWGAQPAAMPAAGVGAPAARWHHRVRLPL
jgi:PAP2 superfamily